MDHFALGWHRMWCDLTDQPDINSLVRISERHKDMWRAIKPTAGKEAHVPVLNCYLPGRFYNGVQLLAELPVVGDWCRVSTPFVDEQNEPAVLIETVLPRKSKISRMSAGTDSQEQLLAANVDYVFLVTSVDSDFSVNRLRRYIVLARSGGATPVIVLSKIDTGSLETQVCVEEVRDAFPDIEFVCTSSVHGTGINEIEEMLQPSNTGVFVGSSGVGKSTLVNRLLRKRVQATQSVRDGDYKGRHTTSAAGLFVLQSGGIIIDTAGLREVRILGDEEEVERLLPAVADLIRQCRFSDCRHESEPGCAVQEAAERGDISDSELSTFSKLQREIAFANRKQDHRLERAERKKWKQIAKDNRRRRHM